MNRSRISVVVVASLWLLASCNKADEVSEGTYAPAYTKRDTSSLTDPAVLKYIPADTPFAFVSYQPLPGEILDVMGKIFDPFTELVDDAIQKGLRDGDPQERALATELQGKISRKGLESLGITFQPRVAVYAIGASFVMRMDLKDGNKLSALVDRIETVKPFPMKKQTLGNVTYRSVSEDGLEIIFAITAKEFIFAVVGQKSMADVLPILFMQKQPAKSLAQSGELRRLIGKYGYMGVMTGYFDSHKLADYFTGDASELTQKTMADSGFDFGQISPACKKEFHQLADVAPRVSFGYTEISNKKIDGLGVFEFRKDIAKDLQDWQVAIPGLATLRNKKTLFAMGMGVDVKKVMTFIDSKASAIKKTPYQCEHLRSLNDGANDVAGEINTQIPFLSDSKGGIIVVDDVKFSGFTPTGKGYGLIAIDKPMDLINMAKTFVPGMSESPIKPDGKLVKLKLPIPLGADVHVAVKDQLIGLSMGTEGKKSMSQLMGSQPAKGGPFMVVSYDIGRYFALIGNIYSSTMPSSPSEKAGEKFIRGIGKYMGMTHYEVYLTDEGAVTRFGMNFR